MPARTDVSPGISANRACARSAASSARRAGAVGAVLEQVAVLVEDVVHDLEEQADLVRERPPRRLLALRNLRDPERACDRGGEEAAGLEPVQRGQVGLGPGDVEVLAADHAQRRLRRARARPQATDRRAQAAAPRRGARRRPGSPPPRRSPPRYSAGRGATRRRRAQEGRRGRARRCARAPGPRRPATRLRRSRPLPRAVARQRTGRTRLPPPASA